MTISDIADPRLADEGVLRLDWASREMPTLREISARFTVERPLEGVRCTACLHVTAETANLMLTLKAGGADVHLCASNPLSTQDDIAAALVERHGIPVFAIKGEDDATYYQHIDAALDHGPQLTMDDGADVVARLHTGRQELLDGVLGGTEETTTGVIRLRAMAESGALRYHIVAVNDAETKHFFDNRYGTARARWTGSSGPRTCSWPARCWSWRATAGAARASPCAAAAWAPASSSRRSSPRGRWRP